MIFGEPLKWEVVRVQFVFSQAHPFIGIQVKDIYYTTIVHHQTVDITVGDSSCNHQGINVWVMDPPSISFSENYILEFPLCLFSGLHFCSMHLYRKRVFGMFYVLVTCMVTFFSQM